MKKIDCMMVFCVFSSQSIYAAQQEPEHEWKVRDYREFDEKSVDSLGRQDPLLGYSAPSKQNVASFLKDGYKFLVIEKSGALQDPVVGFLSYSRQGSFANIFHVSSVHLAACRVLLSSAIARLRSQGVNKVACSNVFEIDGEMIRLFKDFGFTSSKNDGFSENVLAL